MKRVGLNWLGTHVLDVVWYVAWFVIGLASVVQLARGEW
jgi:hypothetical protein